MANDGLLCWNCGKPTGIRDRVMRSDICVNCQADLRCCRGCRHYDPYSHMQCKENIQTKVGNKEKANFCEFFQMRDAVKRAGGVHSGQDSKVDKKKKFDDLFKD